MNCNEIREDWNLEKYYTQSENFGEKIRFYRLDF